MNKNEPTNERGKNSSALLRSLRQSTFLGRQNRDKWHLYFARAISVWGNIFFVFLSTKLTASFDCYPFPRWRRSLRPTSAPITGELELWEMVDCARANGTARPRARARNASGCCFAATTVVLLSASCCRLRGSERQGLEKNWGALVFAASRNARPACPRQYLNALFLGDAPRNAPYADALSSFAAALRPLTFLLGSSSRRLICFFRSRV